MVKKRMQQAIVRVPIEDYEEFKANYPAYGSWSWFVREILVRFNDLHKGDTEELLTEIATTMKADWQGGKEHSG